MRWLVGDESLEVVDLGAGTGKLTRVLVALGQRVTAVEPLAEMRHELEDAVPGVTALAGSAEPCPLNWRDAAMSIPWAPRPTPPAPRSGTGERR